jgi:predicted amidohydrolase
VRIAVYQAACTPLDPAANLGALASAASDAAAQGADVVLTPELFATGYAPAELAGWLTPERVENLRDQFAEVARTVGIAVAASFPAQRADGAYEIRAAIWADDGEPILEYGKVHLWGPAERRAFRPSDEAPQVVELAGRKVGLQICYDIEFPEPARALAEAGAEVILVPTAIDHGGSYVPEVLVRARAIENGITIAYANHAGTTNAPEDFLGESVVVGAGGRILGKAGRGPELMIVDVPEVRPDPESADYLGDRRPDVYRSWRGGQ